MLCLRFSKNPSIRKFVQRFRVTSLRNKSSLFEEDEVNVTHGIFPLHVIGAGSIGLLYASSIHETVVSRLPTCPAPVTLLMRSHHEPNLIRKNQNCLFAPVTIRAPVRDGDTQLKSIRISRKSMIPVEIIRRSEQNDELSNINCLLLCTKANDAVPALTSVRERFNGHNCSPTKIIILSNGALAIRDSISNQFPDCELDVIFATTTHGAFVQIVDDGKYCVNHAGEGATCCTNREFVDVCCEVGWRASLLSDADMNVMLWKKLAVNCVINPLTAIHGVKNGKLLELYRKDEQIRFLMSSLLDEISSIAKREIELFSSQHTTERNDDWSQSAQKELSVDSLQMFVNKVMSDTAHNLSSMLQDVSLNRETEVQFLNGYVSRLGKENYGIDCPYNISMCRAVKQNN